MSFTKRGQINAVIAHIQNGTPLMSDQPKVNLDQQFGPKDDGSSNDGGIDGYVAWLSAGMADNSSKPPLKDSEHKPPSPQVVKRADKLLRANRWRC